MTEVDRNPRDPRAANPFTALRELQAQFKYDVSQYQPRDEAIEFDGTVLHPSGIEVGGSEGSIILEASPTPAAPAPTVVLGTDNDGQFAEISWVVPTDEYGAESIVGWEVLVWRQGDTVTQSFTVETGPPLKVSLAPVSTYTVWTVAYDRLGVKSDPSASTVFTTGAVGLQNATLNNVTVHGEFDSSANATQSGLRIPDGDTVPGDFEAVEIFHTGTQVGKVIAWKSGGSYYTLFSSGGGEAQMVCRSTGLLELQANQVLIAPASGLQIGNSGTPIKGLERVTTGSATVPVLAAGATALVDFPLTGAVVADEFQHLRGLNNPALVVQRCYTGLGIVTAAIVNASSASVASASRAMVGWHYKL